MHCTTCGVPVRALERESVTVGGWYSFGRASWHAGRLTVTPYCLACAPGARMAERLECGAPPHYGLTGRAYRGGVHVTRWEDGREAGLVSVSEAQAESAIDARGVADPGALWAALGKGPTTSVTALNAELRRLSGNAGLRKVWAAAVNHGGTEAPQVCAIDGVAHWAFDAERVLAALRALPDGVQGWVAMDAVAKAMRTP